MDTMELDWDKQVNAFNQVWETRRDPPFVLESWVDSDWAKGRTDYLTFLIRVRDETIIEKIKEVQSGLADFSCMDPFPVDYLHITVKELNSFLVQEKPAEDEISEEELPVLIEEARRRLGRFKPFELKLMNLNNFKSTIVVQAHDGGLVRNINGAMLEIPGMRVLNYDYPRFLPHVSVAQYRNTEEYSELIDYLEENRAVVVGPFSVKRVELVIAKLSRKGEYPRLETIEEFKL